MPWANLRGSPVVVEVDRLYVLAGPANDDDNEEEDEEGDGEGKANDDGTATHADSVIAIDQPSSKQRRRRRRPPPTEADADAAIAAAAAADLSLRRRVVAEAELAWAAGKFGGLDAAVASADDAAAAASASSTSETSTSKPSSEDDDDQQAGLLRGLADVILGNLQISISQVHIRYEDPGGGEGEGGKGKGAPSTPPMAAGVTLARLVARTVDASGAPSFVTHDPLSLLRKSAELGRLSLYFDAGAEPWKPPRGRRRWADVPPAGWDVLFADGVSGPSSSAAAALPRPIGLLAASAPASLLPSPAAVRAYVLRPVDGRATYVRAGPTARKKRRLEREKKKKLKEEGDGEEGELPHQSVDASLDAVSLHLSRAQYLGAQSILEAVDAHAARAPHAHLRPPAATVGRPTPAARDPVTGKNAAARAWWVYAARAVCKRLSKQRAFSGSGNGIDGAALRVAIGVRSRYVEAYAASLLARGAALGGDAATREIEEQSGLSEGAMLAFRRLAHARVEAGKARRAASLAAAQAARAASRKTWGEWWRGEEPAAGRSAGGALAPPPATSAATDSGPPPLSDLTASELDALRSMEEGRQAALVDDTATPWHGAYRRPRRRRVGRGRPRGRCLSFNLLSFSRCPRRGAGWRLPGRLPIPGSFFLQRQDRVDGRPFARGGAADDRLRGRGFFFNRLCLFFLRRFRAQEGPRRRVRPKAAGRARRRQTPGLSGALVRHLGPSRSEPRGRLLQAGGEAAAAVGSGGRRGGRRREGEARRRGRARGSSVGPAFFGFEPRPRGAQALDPGAKGRRRVFFNFFSAADARPRLGNLAGPLRRRRGGPRRARVRVPLDRVEGRERVGRRRRRRRRRRVEEKKMPIRCPARALRRRCRRRAPSLAPSASAFVLLLFFSSSDQGLAPRPYPEVLRQPGASSEAAAGAGGSGDELLSTATAAARAAAARARAAARAPSSSPSLRAPLGRRRRRRR